MSVIKSTLKNAFISKISPMLTDWGLPEIYYHLYLIIYYCKKRLIRYGAYTTINKIYNNPVPSDLV
jgi:hypothetical protein